MDNFEENWLKRIFCGVGY